MTEDLAGADGRPAPRWVRTLGGVALAALVVVGALQAQHARPSPVRHPQTGPTDPPVDFGALQASGRTGLRLLVGGHTVTELDVDGRGSRQVPGVPAVTGGYRLTRADAGVLAQAQPDCPGCHPPAYLLTGSGPRVVRIDGYDGVVPADRPDRLWAYRLAPRQDRTGVVRQLDLSGRPLGREYPLPAGLVVQRGTVAGLIVVQCCGPNFALWDPATGRTLRQLGAVLAVTSTRVAWAVPACVLDCPVWLTDLAAGTDRKVDVHADGLGRIQLETGDQSVEGAAFSPDGGTLALLVPHRPTGHSSGPTQELFLLTRDRILRVGASTVAAEVIPAMMWTGSRLLLTILREGSPARLSLATATLDRPELLGIGTLTGVAAVIR
jgi:hypothetical protein